MTRINPAMVDTYPDGIENELRRLSDKVYFIDPKPLKEKIDNIKFLNVTLIGLVSGFVDFPDKSWEEAINEKVPKGTFEGNWKAFEIGKNLYKEIVV